METDIRIVDGCLVFGLEACTCAMGDNPQHAGKMPGYKPCPKCRGTNRTKGGTGKGQCRHCFQGRIVDFNTWETCGRCNGTGTNQADRYSYVPKVVMTEILRDMPIRIHRSGRRQTFNEAYLGIGLVYGCTDYGRYKQLSDEELADHVRKGMSEQSTQGTNICRKEDNRICTAIDVLCHDQGYSVQAAWEIPISQAVAV